MHLLPAGPAAGVRAAGGVQIHPLGRSGRGQHLLLLRPQLAGLERGRLLHRGQRQQLQQVVLDDVPGDADAVEVAGPAADADVLGHGDLHVVDVVVVPHRLEQLIGEAQRHQVLHRLLAQVVVDPEHRRATGTRWRRSGSAPARWPGRGRTASRSPPGSSDPPAPRPDRASGAGRRRSGTGPGGMDR